MVDTETKNKFYYYSFGPNRIWLLRWPHVVMIWQTSSSSPLQLRGPDRQQGAGAAGVSARLREDGPAPTVLSGTLGSTLSPWVALITSSTLLQKTQPPRVHTVVVLKQITQKRFISNGQNKVKIKRCCNVFLFMVMLFLEGWSISTFLLFKV